MVTPHPSSAKTADLIYDACYSAAVGGSCLGLYFLAIDLVDGRALFTPSLLGQVMFMGASAYEVTAVRLDMVAYFSVIHFLMFGALGLLTALAVDRRPALAGRPLLVTLILFLILSAGYIPSGIFLPGVTEVLGLWRILVGNLVTAAGMALLIRQSHAPGTPSAQKAGA